MKKFVTLAAAIFVVLPVLVAGQISGRALADSSAQYLHACGPSLPGYAHCHALILVNPNAGPNNPANNHKGKPPSGGSGRTVATCTVPSSVTASGYTPCDLQSAYNLASTSSTSGAGKTVAIVDAYYNPNAYSDLSTYRKAFGLPTMTNCTITTSAGPCFYQYGQDGTTTLPTRTNAGWIAEQSLDVDMVSAICPNCNIMLIETNSNSFSNLLAGEDTATSKAVAVSNSWGGSEFSQETSAAYDGHFNRPGVAITASSGDGGYGVEYPAASQYVTAVGGTTLSKVSGNWDETAWNGAGSGCSQYEPQPSWQNILNITSNCPSNRAVADVSADADPNTGVDVYDSTRYEFVAPGWSVYGGTSVASPIIASVYALAGNAVTDGSYPYNHASSLYDITSGSNGSCGTDLCTAGTGWDGPTGLGTPNGTGAF